MWVSVGNSIMIVLLCRSVARLGMGDNAGALDDAVEAANIAPKYPQVSNSLLCFLLEICAVFLLHEFFYYYFF